MAPSPFKANPSHIKYRAYTEGDDPNADVRVRPSPAFLSSSALSSKAHSTRSLRSTAAAASQARPEAPARRVARAPGRRRARRFRTRVSARPTPRASRRSVPWIVSRLGSLTRRNHSEPLDDSERLLDSRQKTATQHVRDLANPPTDLTGHRPTPTIIEFLNIHDHTHRVISKVDAETPLFQPFPPELRFHRYEPNKTYEQILWFRNNDYVPRRIKIERPRGGTFSVRRMRGKRGEKLREEPEDAGKKTGPLRNGRPGPDPSVGKVAPGMEVAFKVRFVPTDTEDYALDLVVATERERFVVPIRCVGNKPALDFPDLVAFESTPAKCSSTATRVVRNVGTKRAAFAFHVPDPFAAFPSEGVLEVGEALQVRLEFHPERCGTYEAEMEIDCGEGVAPAVVGLIGDGCEMRVGLDCGEVEMLPTFVRKRTRRVFRVVNRGDRVARFEVKRLADAFLDDEARRRGRARAFGLDEPTLSSARPPLTSLEDDGETDSASSYDSADEDDILGAEAVAFATRREGLDRALGADALHAAGDTEPANGMYWSVNGCRSARNCSGERLSLGAFAKRRGCSSLITPRSTGFLALDVYKRRSAPSASSTCLRALRRPTSVLTGSVMHIATWFLRWV